MPLNACLLALLALTTAPAAAQTAVPPPAPPLTPAQSASLDRAVQLWTNSTTGYTLAPEGDHYRLALKLPSLQASGVIQGGQLSATALPVDGGFWRFDDIRAATPIIISTPALPGRAATQATIDLQGQDGHATIDPSLATTSTMAGVATSMTGTFNVAPALSGSFRTGAITTHALWKPAGPGRVDRSSAAAAGDVAVQVTGKQPLSMTAADIHGEARFKGFSPDRYAALMAFLRANLPNATNMHKPAADGAKPAASRLTAADRRAMHAALDDARQVASSFEVDGAMDDVAFASAGHSVRFRQVSVAEAAAAPDGRLALSYRMTFDGLSSPDLPAVAKAFVPHRFLISPSVSGLSVDAVFAALGALIDEGLVDERNPNALQARAAEILAKGPVSIGLDALAFDFGPATLAGSGAVRVAGARPQDVTAHATVEVKHFNALLKLANSEPSLQQLAPALILLKGIGDEDDSGTVVWKIVYSAGRVLVNGTDLSQMLPHK
jgi:hypothetical protein